MPTFRQFKLLLLVSLAAGLLGIITSSWPMFGDSSGTVAWAAFAVSGGILCWAHGFITRDDKARVDEGVWSAELGLMERERDRLAELIDAARVDLEDTILVDRNVHDDCPVRAYLVALIDDGHIFNRARAGLAPATAQERADL